MGFFGPGVILCISIWPLVVEYVVPRLWVTWFPLLSLMVVGSSCTVQSPTMSGGGGYRFLKLLKKVTISSGIPALVQSIWSRSSTCSCWRVGLGLVSLSKGGMVPVGGSWVFARFTSSSLFSIFFV